MRKGSVEGLAVKKKGESIEGPFGTVDVFCAGDSFEGNGETRGGEEAMM
jgi:hypothetical protein